MTTDITTEILQQLRTDIAEFRADVDNRFDRVDSQFLAMMELVGVALRKDQEHDRRLDQLESRVPSPDS
jgi:BMFP domain-containing protein YqiC